MSPDERRLFVIAYDIPDDRRRTKVATVLEGYGDRLQYSVFVVTARTAKIVRLRGELKKHVVTKEDSIAIFDMGIHATKRIKRLVTFIGIKREISPPDILVF